MEAFRHFNEMETSLGRTDKIEKLQITPKWQCHRYL